MIQAEINQLKTRTLATLDLSRGIISRGRKNDTNMYTGERPNIDSRKNRF